MHHQGLIEGHLEEVAALNAQYLALLLARGAPAADPRLAADSPLLARMARLGEERLAELADCPFLLYTLGEDELIPQYRGFGRAEELADASRGLPALALMSLTWLRSLARRNPFAVRLIAGATEGWCVELAGAAPGALVNHARRAERWMRPRFAREGRFWEDAIAAIEERRGERLRAVRTAGLQRLLSRSAIASAGEEATGDSARPLLRVAEARGSFDDDQTPRRRR